MLITNELKAKFPLLTQWTPTMLGFHGEGDVGPIKATIELYNGNWWTAAVESGSTKFMLFGYNQATMGDPLPMLLAQIATL